MVKKTKEMTADNLKLTSEIFFEKKSISEYKLNRFSLDIYFPECGVALEYDGPDHYDKVANHERDLRKNQLCFEKNIKLIRWPYYFQLTKDVAKFIFNDFYSDKKYYESIKIIYDASNESEVLAPGLHGSKFTPANFTSLGVKRFINDIMSAPISLRSQVIYSLRLYEKMIQKKYGNDYLWLLYPEDNKIFDDFMNFYPEPSHLGYYYKNNKLICEV
jgi:hypothetical protein